MKNLDDVRRYMDLLDNINESLYDLISFKRKLAELKNDEDKFDKITDDILDNEELRKELLEKKGKYFDLIKLLEMEERKYK